ncbi:MAG: type II toxin-antitoxin system ParD family antitoxin [Pseudomonadales bacterium]|nr:type II toxin-antitoxin system ParD family antitoxin [Gammaproteobacteria bacterium]NNL57670.1 type II toxin-antitoxin system ParD family antitoxin [Pseudomonadales bacterium]
MSMIKKSITVTNQQDEWLQAQIASGHYASDSEIVRELIRERQQRQSESEQLQLLASALADGEASGISDRTPQQIKEAVIQLGKDKKRRNGQL